MAAAVRASSHDAATPEPLPESGSGISEIQRVRILDAMARACAELGASNVTVSCVVERSGVSRRTFYEQFHDRDECLLATIDDALGRISKPVLAAHRSSDDWLPRIRAALVAFLGFLEEEPYVARLLVVEILGCGGRALERRQSIIELVAAAIDDGRLVARKAGGPPPMIAEGVVGGVLAVLHARLRDLEEPDSLVELTGHLMGIIVLPYLGPAAARRELSRQVEAPNARRSLGMVDPLSEVDMRLTYRTVRVLASIAGLPGASNRELALAAGVQDQGQISKLVTRLARLGLIENSGAGHIRGSANAWSLTEKGAAVHRATGERTHSS